MDEIRSAYGLLNLKQVDSAIDARHRVANRYREALRSVDGVTFWDDMQGVRHNYSYFPIFINTDKFGISRDELYSKMKEQGVLSRRYFYPLISNFPTYRGLRSASKENLPIGNRMASEVLCLPMHHALNEVELDVILSFLNK
jgi:dTDP-4-amino-4,6-dideoxygalactose transaminase